MTVEQKKETAAEVAARMNAHYPKGSERYVVKNGRVVDLLGHGERAAQLRIQFASAAKRYIEAAEKGDVREVLSLSMQVTEAMERVVKHITFTEVV